MMEDTDFANHIEFAVRKLQVVAVAIDQIGFGNALSVPDSPELFYGLNADDSKIGTNVT